MKDNKSNPKNNEAAKKASAKRETKTLLPESWWLDFAEGELDLAERLEMKTLLKHSEADKAVVQAYQETKGMVAAATIETPEVSDDFMDSLHDKIMEKVASTKMKPARKVLKTHNQRKFAAGASAALMLIVLSIGLVQTNSYNKGLNTNAPDVAQQLLDHALETPESFAQFISYQDANDFFVDVANRGADDLSIDQFDQLMGKKGKVQ